MENFRSYLLIGGICITLSLVRTISSGIVLSEKILLFGTVLSGNFFVCSPCRSEPNSKLKPLIAKM